MHTIQFLDTNGIAEHWGSLDVEVGGALCEFQPIDACPASDDEPLDQPSHPPIDHTTHAIKRALIAAAPTKPLRLYERRSSRVDGVGGIRARSMIRLL